ncbi:MAG: hypothetical protein AB1768_20360 [Pseudomonadota bacterium]|jgi:hypothetical protein
MWYLSKNLPQQRSIFLVRKWVSRNDGSAVSFVAENPDGHIHAFGFGNLQFNPDVDVVVGSVLNGRFYDEHGEIDEGFDLNAILAWTPIPDQYLRESADAAEQVRVLIDKVR